ncbi:superoxide dismutase family protein [Streptomyces longispororuber]|uniref:superoxide dismutase family protein n=1 Tax=Streptomyces TaxID=1883 RepID=UPI0024A87FAA|nr:superoxide dismutase family protein [Streptomyces sp. CC224B]
MVAGVLTSAVAAAVLAASGTTGGTDSVEVRAQGRFAPPAAFVSPSAITYDQKLVPAGSWIEVTQRSDHKGTKVQLRVKGMKPGYAYGVHVHQKPCGADPMAAGGHYQNKPSQDPGDVNPDNEVWLDFTAQPNGSGRSSAYHDWGFRRGEAASVVLHREQGGAGARLACFSVPFAPPPGA